jgi:hypothetical protein
VALRHQLLEQGSHCLYSGHQMIQFRKLSAGERSPAFRGASEIAEAKEQLPNLRQCKTKLARSLNDCQPVENRRIVTPLPTHPLRWWKQPNLLVISNC